MASLLQRGAEWLASKLTDVKIAGETITYTRGADSVTLTATPGKSLLRLIDGGGGSRIEWTDADFLVTGSELILAGLNTEPRRGDRITWAKNSTVYTFEVLPYEKDEACWRWADGNRVLMRVHVIEVATP